MRQDFKNGAWCIGSVILLLAIAASIATSCTQPGIEKTVVCNKPLLSKAEGEVALFFPEEGIIRFLEKGDSFDNPPITPVDFSGHAYMAETLPDELLGESYYLSEEDFANRDKPEFVTAAAFAIKDNKPFSITFVKNYSYSTPKQHPLHIMIEGVEEWVIPENERTQLVPVETMRVEPGDIKHYDCLRIKPSLQWKEFGSKYRYLLVPVESYVIGVSSNYFETMQCYLIVDAYYMETSDRSFAN